MTINTATNCIRRTLAATVVVCLVCAYSHHAYAQSAAARVDSIDSWLGGLRTAKRSQPQGMLQQWVRLQESMRDLATIAREPSTDSATAWRARYVAGYGFWVAELFDIAAATARELAEGTSDRAQRALALRDLAQSLENAGLFGESAAESERLLAVSEQPGKTAINNHALRLLKAGRYDECLDYVNRIEMSADVAHTRIFSARALAYRGRYDEAATELRAACDSGETAACSMLERLREEAPEKYWRDDREYRHRVWQPYNRIDDTLALAADGSPRLRGVRAEASLFAPSFWFNEIHGLYPKPGEHEVRARRPEPFVTGRIGAIAIDGVPFVAFLIDATTSDADVRAAVERYLATVHGMSAWGPAMEEHTRAQVARIATADGGGSLVVVTHAAWQQEWARRAFPGASWTELAKR